MRLVIYWRLLNNVIVNGRSQMTERDVIQVFDREGHSGQAIFSSADDGSGRVLVRLEDGGKLLLDPTLLERQADGSYRLDMAFDALVARAGSADEQVIPIVEEDVAVEKRVVERGRVRIQKSVTERDVLVDPPLIHEHVEVERIPVNKIVETAPAIRQEGDTMIVPVLEEVVVAEIRLMLKEEVHITRKRSEVREPQQVRLRREHVSIDRIDEGADAHGDTSQPHEV